MAVLGCCCTVFMKVKRLKTSTALTGKPTQSVTFHMYHTVLSTYLLTYLHQLFKEKELFNAQFKKLWTSKTSYCSLLTLPYPTYLPTYVLPDPNPNPRWGRGDPLTIVFRKCSDLWAKWWHSIYDGSRCQPCQAKSVGLVANIILTSKQAFLFSHAVNA